MIKSLQTLTTIALLTAATAFAAAPTFSAWQEQYAAASTGRDMVIDSAGDAIVVGKAGGGSGPLWASISPIAMMIPGGNTVVVKYDGDNGSKPSTPYVSTSLFTSLLNRDVDVKVVDKGYEDCIYVAGKLGFTDFVLPNSYAQTSDIFLFKLDSNLQLVWAYQHSASDEQDVTDIVVYDNDIYLSGTSGTSAFALKVVDNGSTYGNVNSWTGPSNSSSAALDIDENGGKLVLAGKRAGSGSDTDAAIWHLSPSNLALVNSFSYDRGANKNELLTCIDVFIGNGGGVRAVVGGSAEQQYVSGLACEPFAFDVTVQTTSIQKPNSENFLTASYIGWAGNPGDQVKAIVHGDDNYSAYAVGMYSMQMFTVRCNFLLSTPKWKHIVASTPVSGTDVKTLGNKVFALGEYYDSTLQQRGYHFVVFATGTNTATVNQETTVYDGTGSNHVANYPARLGVHLNGTTYRMFGTGGNSSQFFTVREDY